MSEKPTLSSYLQWNHVPELRDPILVVGFYGWSDAGSVSSDTVLHLIETLEPRVFATLSNEPFVNYTIDRPVGRIEHGLIRQMEPMVTELGCCSNPDGDHDLILVLGKEPHFNWLLYTHILLAAMRRLNVKRLYTLGGVQDTVSHSSDPLVSIVGSSESVVNSTMELADCMQTGDYYGPVSIHSWLVRMCGESGVGAASLWGHVPAYLQNNPRLVACLTELLGHAVGMKFPVEGLIRRSIELDRKINEILAKDPNLKHFVESIEDEKNSYAPSGGGDKIIRLNDFLRRDSHNDPQS